MLRTEGYLQRPLRSHRQNKTSQGLRSRERKPLMAQNDHANLADYGELARPASGGEPVNLVVKGQTSFCSLSVVSPSAPASKLNMLGALGEIP